MLDCSLNWQEISPVTGPCIRPGGTALTRRALEVCRFPAGSRIIDIGCGAAGTLEYLKRKDTYCLTGLDPSESLLKQANKRLEQQCFVRGRGEVLPFKNKSFDALFCECVLSILNDRVAALAEFSRVLDEAGFLIMSDVFSQDGPRRGDRELVDQGRPLEGLFTREGLWEALAELGFSLLLWEEHRTLLKEFLARMILSGENIPESWRCGKGRERNNGESSRISYFLLVAQKEFPGS